MLENHSSPERRYSTYFVTHEGSTMSGNVHCLTDRSLVRKEAKGPMSFGVVRNSLCVIIIGGMHRHAAGLHLLHERIRRSVKDNIVVLRQKVLGLLGSFLSEFPKAADGPCVAGGLGLGPFESRGDWLLILSTSRFNTKKTRYGHRPSQSVCRLSDQVFHYL